MLAISTALNYKHARNFRKMLRDIKGLGVNAIELGYEIERNHLKEIIGLLKNMDMKVASVHNFCPKPGDKLPGRHASGAYRLSSLDENERQKAIEYTKATIDTACRVRCPIVVFHAGTIDSLDEMTFKLLQMYRKGKKKAEEFARLRKELLTLRERQKMPYLKALTKSLSDVMVYAFKNHIRLGLETRYYPNEIPNFEEIGHFLKFFHAQGMFYWHDAGHGEVNERLGIRKHIDFLNHYKKYLIGFHVHGQKGIEDHFAPFEGDLDLDMVKPFVKNEHALTIESHAKSDKKKLKEAVKILSTWQTE